MDAIRRGAIKAMEVSGNVAWVFVGLCCMSWGTVREAFMDPAERKCHEETRARMRKGEVPYRADEHRCWAAPSGCWNRATLRVTYRDRLTQELRHVDVCRECSCVFDEEYVGEEPLEGRWG